MHIIVTLEARATFHFTHVGITHIEALVIGAARATH